MGRRSYPYLASVLSLSNRAGIWKAARMQSSKWMRRKMFMVDALLQWYAFSSFEGGVLSALSMAVMFSSWVKSRLVVPDGMLRAKATDVSCKNAIRERRRNIFVGVSGMLG